MKKNLLNLLMCMIVPLCMVKAQTTIWSSDCESLIGWVGQDLDGDGSNWFSYSGGTTFGFSSGKIYGSPSVSSTPDNVILTPAFSIPTEVSDLLFDFKVGSSSATSFSETFAVYIQEVGVGGTFDTMLHQETLASGGPGSVKNVSILLPNTYAGKTVKLIIRHFNCTNQDYLLIDDFNVSYGATLTINENHFQEFSFAPNPARDYLLLSSEKALASLELYNIMGQMIKKFKPSTMSDNRIDVSFLSNGTYFMRIQIEGQSEIFKFLKY